MLFLKKIKNFWCCHKNIVVLWQNKEEWHKASIAIQRLTQNGEAELYRHPLKILPTDGSSRKVFVGKGNGILFKLHLR